MDDGFLLPDPLALSPQEAALAVRAELARRAVDREAALAAGASFARLLQPLEQSERRLCERMAPLAHAARVLPDPDRREIFDRLAEEVATRSAREGADPRLLAAVEAILAGERLSEAERAVAEAWRRSLEASGAGLRAEARARLAAIEAELTRLELEYEYAIRDAEDAFALDVREEALPELAPEERAPLAAAARAAGRDGWLRVGLRAAEAELVLTRSPDRDLRETMDRARATVASELGPGGPAFDNGTRLLSILALRQERARLLGKPSPAHAAFLDRMAKSPEEALAFLRDLTAIVRPRAEAELARLADFARSRLGLRELAPWDLPWVRDRYLRAAFGIARERLRRFFPLPAVLAGIGRFLEDRFALRLKRLATAAYPGAFWCLIERENGECLGALLCDLLARKGKQDGAWMDLWRPPGGPELPIAILVADALPPGEGGEPSLLPGELLTLFHELGHVIHALIDRSGYMSLAGPDGAPFDGMELPSMLFEGLGRDAAALAACSRDPESEAPLAEAFCRRLAEALRFGEAIDLLRQVELARFDLELHLDAQAASPGRALAILERIRRDTALLPVPSWDRLPNHFGHLFGGGYEAGYYGYLWAEGLARQLSCALTSRAAGARFLADVLAPGEIEPLADRLRRFLGSDPDPLAGLALAGNDPDRARLKR